MDRDYIVTEIRRTTEANGGNPLGVARFFKETGISESDWAGKFWVRWGDALIEAGYFPNSLQHAYSDDYVIEKLASFIRELGHYPVIREIKMRGRSDPEFPSHNVFQNRGKKAKLIEMVRQHCAKHAGYDDVMEIIAPLLVSNKKHAIPSESLPIVGYVYLMKSGKYYKIGYSSSVGRREYELSLQLPEKVTKVHAIETDDPAGIEAYWHRRFANKRKNGEWFELDRNDINTFKRRKFM